LSVFIFIVFKRPEDLFKSFNKRPDVQFSSFQNQNFFHAERKATLQRNTEYLKRKLQDLNKDGRLLAVLDEDDILNADETIRRQKLGIDINYLVKHFGEGDDYSSSGKSDVSGISANTSALIGPMGRSMIEFVATEERERGNILTSGHFGKMFTDSTLSANSSVEKSASHLT
jgi:hypothetical protein